MKSWFQRQSYQKDVINTEMKMMIFNGNSNKSSNKKKVCHLCWPTIYYLKRLITLLENTFICFITNRTYSIVSKSQKHK